MQSKRTQMDSADASVQTHYWRIFGPCLRQDRRYERFASSRWSVFFIRADVNGRKASVCVAPLGMPLVEHLGSVWLMERFCGMCTDLSPRAMMRP
jgi:hypothetical protein